MSSTQNCRCCNKPLHLFDQASFRGTPIPMGMCENRDCALFMVTLEAETLAAMTADDIAAYSNLDAANWLKLDTDSAYGVDDASGGWDVAVTA